MGRLNTYQRSVVGEYCKSAIRNKKQVVVYCISNDGGQQVASQLQTAYPSYKFYKAENQAGFVHTQVTNAILTLGIGNAIAAGTQTWKNFSVKTGSADEAQNLLKEINSCIEEYGGAVNPYGGDPDNPGPVGSDDPSSGTGKTVDWLTYIVIGVAVMLLLLWAWERFRKR